jgi:hypothetical protein
LAVIVRRAFAVVMDVPIGISQPTQGGNAMKKQYSLIALSLALFAGSALAAGDGAVATPKSKQQTKLGTCSKEAKANAIKGAERRQFMSTCMKAKA